MTKDTLFAVTGIAVAICCFLLGYSQLKGALGLYSFLTLLFVLVSATEVWLCIEEDLLNKEIKKWIPEVKQKLRK